MRKKWRKVLKIALIYFTKKKLRSYILHRMRKFNSTLMVRNSKNYRKLVDIQLGGYEGKARWKVGVRGGGATFNYLFS